MPVPVEVLRFFDRAAADGAADVAADGAPAERTAAGPAPIDGAEPPDPVRPADTTASAHPNADGPAKAML
jgi:hypothetical protein